MVFSSLEFLIWFMPCVILIHYLLPAKVQNAFLLLASVVFYAYGSIEHPWFILLLGGAVLLNYGLGIVITDATQTRRTVMSKMHFVIGIVMNMGLLFLFKYLGFFAGIFKKEISLQIILPLGISFFTFQAVTYLSDVYHERIEAEGNLIRFTNYMIMFPQLLAGPIVRYSQVQTELKERKVTGKEFEKGIELFILGLFIKAVLATRLGGLWSNIGAIGYESISTPLAWLGIFAYSLELYFDFYGYSLMAIGLGHMLGFNLPDNFRYPYESVTMTDFWRRWHITLGSWFKDYIYIPLGGNRKGKLFTYLNLFVVWTLTGLWHGADWNFILWGIGLFVVIANEKLWMGKVLNKHKLVGHLYMIVLIPLSWMVFAISDMNQLGVYAGRLIGLGGQNIYAGDFLKYIQQYGLYVVAGILCSTKVPRVFFQMIKKKPVRYGVLLVMLVLSLYMIYHGMNDPFMYFQF